MQFDVLLASKRCLRQDYCVQERGFTLIELIMVLVIMGVLAVFAAPRLFNRTDFDARGFHDETLAYLRFAQKTAVAQRRTVCVAFGGSNSITLTIAANAGTVDCSAAGTLTGPKGVTPVVLSAAAGVAYTAPPTNFNFNGLGQPLTTLGAAMATQTLQVSGLGRTITVESATGYVHD